MVNYVNQKVCDLSSINTYDEMTLEEFSDWSEEIKKEMTKAVEDQGYSNVRVILSSSREPYDDFLGPVEVTLYGSRPETQEEKRRREEQEKIEKLAKEMGVTFYEAGIIKSLKERGKL